MAIDGLKAYNLISRGFQNVSSRSPMLNRGYQLFEKTLGKTGTNVQYVFDDLGNFVKKTVSLGDGNLTKAKTGLSKITNTKLGGKDMYLAFFTGTTPSNIAQWASNAKVTTAKFFNVNWMKNEMNRDQLVKMIASKMQNRLS